MHAVARFFVLLAALASEVLALDFSSFKDAAQDGDGLVWAIGSAQLSGQHISDELFSTDGSAWHRVACPGTADYAGAQKLVKLRDGDVLCVWSSHNEQDESKLLLSRHRGEASRLFARIDLAPKSADKWYSSPVVLESSRGELWVFSGSRLWRVAPDAIAKVVREFAEEDLSRPLEKDDNNLGGFELIEDGMGRVWLFGIGQWEETRTLKHAHFFDGKAWHEPATIPGLPDGLIASVASRDEDHLWCARFAGGLYEIDLRALTAKLIAEPQPGAFRSVQGLRSHGGAMLIATLAGDPHDFGSPYASRQTAALWLHHE